MTNAKNWMGTTLAAAALIVGAAWAVAENGHTVEAVALPGEALSLNLPSASGGGGFIGGTYAQNGSSAPRELGTFTTDIQSGTTIFAVLGQVMSTGSATAADVHGAFDLDGGTLNDLHDAHLQVVAEAPPSAGYEVVVVATAQGVIDGGTGRYKKASGTSDLYLKIEIDAQSVLPPRAIEGTFEFILD